MRPVAGPLLGVFCLVATAQVSHADDLLPRLSLGAGHRDMIRSIEFSADGKWLASAGDDESLILWDVTTRKPAFVVRSAHANKIFGVAISPDNNVVATGGDGHIKLWNRSDGKPLGELQQKNTGIPQFLTFAPDGKTLASVSTGLQIALWDWKGRKLVTKISTRGGSTAGGRSADGQILLNFIPSGKGASGELFAWSLKDRRPLGSLRMQGYPNRSGIHPDGWVVTPGPDGYEQLRLENMFAKKESIKLEGRLKDVAVTDSAFSPDGTLVASALTDDSVCIWEVATGKLKHEFRKYGMMVAFSPDGKTLAACSRPFHSIRLLDVVTGKVIGTLEGKPSDMTIFSTNTPRPPSLAVFAPDGKSAALATYRNVSIWDTKTGNIKHFFDANAHVTSIALSANGNRLAAAGDGNFTKVWDTDTGKEIASHKPTFSAGSLAFVNDNKSLLATGMDGRLVLWDVESGQEFVKYWNENLQKAPIRVVAIEDGKKFVAALKNEVQDWTVAGFRCLKTYHCKGSVTLHPVLSRDGARLAIADAAGKVEIWSCKEEKRITTIETNEKKLTTLCLTPDGKRLLCGAASGKVWLYSADSGELVATLFKHARPVTSIDVSADNRTCITISVTDQDPALVWDLP